MDDDGLDALLTAQAQQVGPDLGLHDDQGGGADAAQYAAHYAAVVERRVEDSGGESLQALLG